MSSDWIKCLESQEITKSDLNQLVLNYLLFEGYETTAVKFAEEMRIDLNNNEDLTYGGLTSIRFRKDLKTSLLRGDIQLVIDKLKLEYPDLIEKNQFLHFKLLLLNLIEMIKSHNKDEDQMGDKDEFILSIIDFARKKLTNKALKNPEFMEELELTMTLLLYSSSEQADYDKLPNKLKELLGVKLRRDISNLINKSILLEDIPHLLEFNCMEDGDTHEKFYYNNELIDSNLKKMIKLWLWGEGRLDDLGNTDFNKLEI